MNGEDLPVDHGYPFRVIFSGWGGNTAVKWLGRIEASKRRLPAQGPQRVQVLIGPDYPEPKRPTAGPIRSAIELDEDVTLMPGDLTLRGRAWSGAGAIDRVDVAMEKLVSTRKWVSAWDGTWRTAKLLETPEPYMWTRFEVPWTGVRPGHYRVMSRARDEDGNTRAKDQRFGPRARGRGPHAEPGSGTARPSRRCGCSADTGVTTAAASGNATTAANAAA